MKAVCLALKAFLPNIRGHQVLVQTDNTSVVSDIKCQGSVRWGSLCALVRDIFIWAQTNLSSLRAGPIPGILNTGADLLSWGNIHLGEWSLNPQTAHLI